MRKISILGYVVVIAVLAGTLLVAAPAVFAASNHGISGTVYSPCSGHTWYTSGVERTKSGTGPIKAQFSEINPGGLKWKLLSKSNVQIGSLKTWTKNETGIWRTFKASVAAGTRFYNSFAEYDGQCGYADYDFIGTEYF